MRKEKVVGSEESEMEEGEMETHTDDENGGVAEGEEAGGANAAGEQEGEYQSHEDGEADPEKKSKKKKKKQQPKKKKASRAGNKMTEAEIESEREISTGSPRKTVVKEEPREAEEGKGLEDENGKADENGKRDGKWKKADDRGRLVLMISPAKRQSFGRRSLENQETQKSETEEDEDGEVEKGDEVDEDEKSEEQRKEVEKDLALTMSSSWAPLSERERESLKVSNSGRGERDRDVDTYREVQSQSLKERGRVRDDDGEPSKEKPRQKKQKFSEPPLLSLSLPDTSLHLASSDPGCHVTKSKSKSSGPVPRTSENERSFRSFGPTQSQSNGYTNSLSLSLSHPFFHNASCSLTQNSFDDKEGTTCSSRQILLLKDEPTEGSRGSSFRVREQSFHMASEGSHDRSKHRRELPLYQKLFQSGNAQFLQGTIGNGEGTRDSSRSFMDERPTESLVNQLRGKECSPGSDQNRWKEEASLASGGPELSRTSHGCPWSIQKDTRERHRQEVWSSPSRSASFQDRRFDPHKLLERERRPGADDGRELSLSGSRGFLERNEESAGHDKGVVVVEEESAGGRNTRKIERSWLLEIVTESIPLMAQKLQEVPVSFLEGLKKCLQDTLGSTKRKDEFVSLQRTLQRRADLTTDSLLQCHRTQLEVLVALKTGIPAFLHSDIPLTNAALAEIFLGTKCRNVACQSQLPADDCECKVCSSKGGFCNACMCVVCSKFDFDANTCRWIGCDFCLHWCHSECGIHMGHISSGISTRGSSDDSVMQFRCIGCEHTSELYGFVKDVFTMCAKDWPLETLARELQCVRKIFHRSEDLRGKQLFGKAEQLLVKLDSSRDGEAVCQSMMKFFAAGEKGVPAARASDVVRDAIPLPREREMTSQLADAVRDAIHVIKAPNADGMDLEKARAALQFFDHEVDEKRQEASELHHERAWQKSQIEELENIVQIKQAEAKMFQIRADEVRREAEGLQRIVQAKNEKIEEEYKLKLVKLRLNESEERRRKWSQEVQNKEKAKREYSAMKMSMVSDIRELLKIVEAAKGQLL